MVFILQQGDVIKGYCDLVDSLVGGASEEATPTPNPVTSSGDILVSDDKGIRTITLNKPAKKNAITVEVRILEAIHVLTASVIDNIELSCSFPSAYLGFVSNPTNPRIF